MRKSTLFWDRVAKSDGCWEWVGPRSADGYGKTTNVQGRPVRAHRVAYEQAIGPIPAGLQLDHLCRNRACVRPDHLEPVTARENLLRGENEAARRARQTHCKRGHPLSGPNLKVDTRGFRRCLRCLNLWRHIHQAEKQRPELVAEYARLTPGARRKGAGEPE